MFLIIFRTEIHHIFAVDFNKILEQACLRETALGELLRLCEHRCGKKVKSETRIQIIKVRLYSLRNIKLIWHYHLRHHYFQRYVLEADCLKRGWILTGYPKTVEEFKLLDMIPTPPNR